MTHVTSIEKGIHDFNVWIKDIKSDLECSDQDAYTALYSTIQTLRDRLPLDNVVNFGAQLPLIIKGVYYDGWSPKNFECVDKLTFTSRIHSFFNNDPKINPENVIQTVFCVLQKHVGRGEINNVKEVLPSEIEHLFNLAFQKRDL